MRLKNTRIFLLALVCVFFSGSVFGETKIFSDLDFYSSNWEKGYKAGWKEKLNGHGLDTNNLKIISSIANGFRLGFVTNLPNKRDSIGLSLGYVSGPAGKISFTQSDLISPWEISASQEIAFDFYRFLAEYERAYFSLNKIEGRIGLGIGLAMGKATSKTTIYDTTASFSPFPSNYMLVVQSKSVVGFTWEIGPEVVFKGERANLVFGVTFSGFPYFEEDGWMFESKWHPVGVKIGVEF